MGKIRVMLAKNTNVNANIFLTTDILSPVPVPCLRARSRFFLLSLTRKRWFSRMFSLYSKYCILINNTLRLFNIKTEVSKSGGYQSLNFHPVYSPAKRKEGRGHAQRSRFEEKCAVTARSQKHFSIVSSKDSHINDILLAASSTPLISSKSPFSSSSVFAFPG